MLFDLAADPHETTNLAGQRPDLVGHGRRLLDDWVAEQLARSGAPDPLLEVIAEGGPLHTRVNFRYSYVEKMFAVLRRTGRAHHADWLAEHGGAPRE